MLILTEGPDPPHGWLWQPTPPLDQVQRVKSNEEEIAETILSPESQEQEVLLMVDGKKFGLSTEPLAPAWTNVCKQSKKLQT